MKAKIIKINNNQTNLIERAKENDRIAQKELYDSYSPAMLSVCRLYIQDLHFAEDVMLRGFLKIFTNLKSYKEQNHLYAWMRRIMINECIDFLRSNTHKVIFTEWSNTEDIPLEPLDYNVDNEFIQSIIDTLPSGCKMIFNLYVFEDFTHKEIADRLDISVGTSKSQLAYAKNILKEKLQKKYCYER